MKISLITITVAIAGLFFPSCVDRSDMIGVAAKGNEPNIVITQPSAKDAIAPVVETLRQAFTRSAEATSGARVPNPQISILLADGKVLTVPAPTVDGGLFGSASPKARQTRLEGHLKALETKLTSGCSGQLVTTEMVRDNPQIAFKAGNFNVWAAGGGGNPWTAKEAGPAAFVEDRATFADILGSPHDKGGNFFIVSDTTGTGIGGPSSSKVETKPTGEAEPDSSVAISPRTGDTIIVGVTNYPPANRSNQSSAQAPETHADHPKQAATSLPHGAVQVGDAIRFATNSSKLTAEGHTALKRAAELLKQRSDTGWLSLFLVAKADCRSDEKHNEWLSQKRAEVVQVALLAEGISVEKIIAVGESLSPDNTAQADLAGQRTVQLWALPEHIAGQGAPVTPLAQQAP